MAPTKARTLAGRRIVITRAPEQAEELVRRLTELGAEVVLLPMVRFLAAIDTSQMDSSIATLQEFDWLVFTSANAVRFFLGRCRLLGRTCSGLRLRIAVVGPATQEALEAEGLDAAFVPRSFIGAALVKELSPQLAGRRVLLPRSDRASDELPRALREAGATTTEVVAYRTAGPDPLDAAALAELQVNLEGRGKIDAMAFFSPSAFHNCAQVLGDDALRKMSMHSAFAAVGPVTAEAIRDAGLSVAVAAPSATTECLVAALERYFTDGSTLEMRPDRSQKRIAREDRVGKEESR